MQKELLNAKGLKIVFDKKTIVQDIDISIKEGEIIGLIGPSGSGKTTIIRAMIGNIKANEGQLYAFDTLLPSIKVCDKIGYMAQTDALYEDLSGYENLLFFGRLYNIKEKELKEKIKEVLELTHLAEDAKKIVFKYSGGMKRRLSMAISWLHNPQLLILDEPTVGLDPNLRNEFKELFKKLANEGKAILKTTHVMEEVLDCDILYMLREGKIIAKGTPKELIEKYGDLEKAFISFCQNN